MSDRFAAIFLRNASEGLRLYGIGVGLESALGFSLAHPVTGAVRVWGQDGEPSDVSHVTFTRALGSDVDLTFQWWRDSG